MSYEPIAGAGVVLVAIWTVLLVLVDKRRIGPALRSSFVMVGIPLTLVAALVTVVPQEHVTTVAIVGLLALIAWSLISRIATGTGSSGLRRKDSEDQRDTT